LFIDILKKEPLLNVNRVWGIFLTFIFITFTRLFFRSGSNLPPAEQTAHAWKTAQSIINQIGGSWKWAQIPEILATYKAVFLLFTLGMIIHWLPSRWKRWYRTNFCLLPTWAIGLAVVATVFLVYQFITADLQPFIYFQF
jgi:hypothetical protein